ncbi:FkbM family methyltransferase [Streptosporangium sp. NPDC051022]|uniref:FkbM family methyltransferase n=1 Tax=Streptosporangium sp. NPDC051022 TaxID=3155752 RepID=UPI003417D3E5
MTVTRRRLPNGLEVTQVDPGEAALLYREIFVEKSYLRDDFPVTSPRVVFDIGANIGLASMFFKQCFPGAFVVAAEPGPDPYLALRENFARHVPGGVTHNVALAERGGVARFGYYPAAPAESGLYADPAGETELAKRLLMESGFTEPEAERFSRERHRLSYVECRTVTLSELIRETGVDRIDLLKIDVEKSECDVLAGIEEPDWARIRETVIEVHDVDGRLARVLALLRGHGFQVRTCQENRLSGTDMHMLFATRTD